LAFRVGMGTVTTWVRWSEHTTMAQQAPIVLRYRPAD
jgi:hypothetical protein